LAIVHAPTIFYSTNGIASDNRVNSGSLYTDLCFTTENLSCQAI
jgi:hypothetical protein